MDDLQKIEKILDIDEDSKVVLFDHIEENEQEHAEIRQEIGELEATVDSQFTTLKSEVGDELVNLDNKIKTIALTPGEKGEKGEKGDKGDKGEPGDDGRDGRDGMDGKDGKDGIDGVDGLNGKDGSPDTGEQIVTKINNQKTQIDASKIKNLPQPVINNIVEKVSGGSGLETVKSNGSIVKQGASQLNFVGANVTPTVNGATVDVSGEGAGKTFFANNEELKFGNTAEAPFSSIEHNGTNLIVEGDKQDNGSIVKFFTGNNGRFGVGRNETDLTFNGAERFVVVSQTIRFNETFFTMNPIQGGASVNYVQNAFGAQAGIELQWANGSITTPTNLSNGNIYARIRALGYHTDAYIVGGELRFTTNKSIGASKEMPTRFGLFLCPDNSVTNLEAMRWDVGALQTTNATQTTLHQFDLAANTTYIGSFYIKGTQSDFTNRCAFKVDFAAHRDSGAAVLDATTYTVSYKSDAAWDVTVVASSNSIQVKVTGKASTTINWESTLTIR